MFYPETAAAARQHALIAIDLMARHAVAPNPTNFSVWYDYAGKRNPELVRAIDALIRAHSPFSPAQCADLYAGFFGVDRTARSCATPAADCRRRSITFLAYGVRCRARRSRSNHRLAAISGTCRGQRIGSGCRRW